MGCKQISLQLLEVTGASVGLDHTGVLEHTPPHTHGVPTGEWSPPKAQLPAQVPLPPSPEDHWLAGAGEVAYPTLPISVTVTWM